MKLTSKSAYFYGMQIMVEGKKRENRINIDLTMTRVNIGLLVRNDTSQIYQTCSKKSFNLWSG